MIVVCYCRMNCLHTMQLIRTRACVTGCVLLYVPYCISALSSLVKSAAALTSALTSSLTSTLTSSYEGADKVIVPLSVVGDHRTTTGETASSVAMMCEFNQDRMYP